MTGMTQGARSHPRQTIILAIVLIGVGAASLVANVVPDSGGVIVLLIGLGLLAAFAFLREYGYLVPGAIMTGLGIGIVASLALDVTEEVQGGIVVLGLGLGFIGIWVIGALARVEGNHWWPFVPGGILASVGAALLIGGQAIDLLAFWPVVLIAIGIVVLGRAVMELRQR